MIFSLVILALAEGNREKKRNQEYIFKTEKKLTYVLLPQCLFFFNHCCFLLMESQPQRQLLVSPGLIAENTFLILLKSFRGRIGVSGF